MKCDITVEKRMTINIGNFSNIQPGITVTLKDIDKKDLDKKTKQLSNYIDAVLVREIAMLGSEAVSMQKITFANYIDGLQDEMDNINKTIKDFSEEL